MQYMYTTDYTNIDPYTYHDNAVPKLMYRFIYYNYNWDTEVKYKWYIINYTYVAVAL